MKLILFLSLLVLGLVCTKANCHTQTHDSTDSKFFVGNSLLMLGNFIPHNPNSPDFVQLNFGYPSNIMGLNGSK